MSRWNTLAAITAAGALAGLWAVVANLRNSARENLKIVLGTDPERLQIGERGVILAK